MVILPEIHCNYASSAKIKIGTAQLADLGGQKVEIGMPVEMVTRKLRSDGDERGIIVYGCKFRPLLR